MEDCDDRQTEVDMGDRGPRPMPLNIAVLTGSKNAAAARDDKADIPDPPVILNIPDPPEYLGAEAATVFMQTARKLSGMRVLTDADIEALSLYAETFVRWREAVAQVRKEGMLVKGVGGLPVRHPLMDVISKAQGDCLRLLLEFGMTPSSRVKVRKNA